jgi:ATP/maltotriose-dependent transcriptional regulator MalT
VNAQRDFKDLGADKVLRVRRADPQESIALLTQVEQASTGDGGVDNVTLNQAMRTLAVAEAKAGDPDRAQDVLDRMVTLFQDKQLAPHVLDTIRAQAQDTRAAIAELTGEREPGEEKQIPGQRAGAQRDRGQGGRSPRRS